MDTFVEILVLSVSVFLLLEIIIRFYISFLASDTQFKKFATFAQISRRASKDAGKPSLSPHRYLGYYPTPSFKLGKTTHNSFGFRGNLIKKNRSPDEFRILTLGGSTTYGHGVEDDKNTYPGRLEQALQEMGHTNVKVLNFGVSGYGVRECVINFLQRGLDFEPNLIIFYEGLNDVYSRFVWPSDFASGDDVVCRPPLISAIYHQALLEHSSLFRYIMIRCGRLSPQIDLNRTLTPTLNDDRADGHCFTHEFLRQRRSNDYPDGIFRNTPAMTMLKNNPPTFFKRHLEALVSLAKNNKVDIMLVTFAHSPLFADPVVSSPEYNFAISEHNEIQRTVAKDHNIQLFDLANIFGSSRDYFLDGRHMNEAGCARMAELIAHQVKI